MNGCQKKEAHLQAKITIEVDDFRMQPDASHCASIIGEGLGVAIVGAKWQHRHVTARVEEDYSVIPQARCMT